MTWQYAPKETDYFVLLFQRETQKGGISAGERNSGGLWIFDKSITSLPKVASTGSPFAVNKNRSIFHDKLGDNAKFNVLEGWFNSTFTRQEKLTFKLYAVDADSVAVISNALIKKLDGGSADGGKNVIDPDAGGFTKSIDSTDRMADLEKQLGDKILKSSEFSFYAQERALKFSLAAYDWTKKVTNNNGSLKDEYGVQFDNAGKITKGDARMPALSITQPTNGTEHLVLVLQDENVKNWGHGIWIIDKSFDSGVGPGFLNGVRLPKKDGTVTGKTKADFVHPTLSGQKGVTIIERFYALTPPSKHVYKYYLFCIGNGLTKAQITTELNKVKRRSTAFAGIGILQGASGDKGGLAPDGVTDRAAKIKELLGVNIIEDGLIETAYPEN